MASKRIKAITMSGVLVLGLLVGLVGLNVESSQAWAANPKPDPIVTPGQTTADGNASTAISAASISPSTLGKGKLTVTRDGSVGECCGNNATLALAERSSTTGHLAGISFHNSGIAEGTLDLAPGGWPRRIRLYDHQSQGMSLEVHGAVTALKGAPACSGRPEGYSFVGDGCLDTGMFSGGDGDLRFYSNQNMKMRMSSNGDVCIGKC